MTQIELKVFDHEGTCTHEGLFSDTIDVPTHGSVSIKMGGNQWLNILSSEWMLMNSSSEIKTWATARQ